MEKKIEDSGRRSFVRRFASLVAGASLAGTLVGRLTERVSAAWADINALHLGVENPTIGFYANDDTTVDLPNDKGFFIVGNCSDGSVNGRTALVGRNANTGGYEGHPNGPALAGANAGYGFGVIGTTENVPYPPVGPPLSVYPDSAGVYGRAYGIGVNGEALTGTGVRGIGSYGVRGEANQGGGLPLCALGTSGAADNLQEWMTGGPGGSGGTGGTFTRLSAVNYQGWLGIGTSTPERHLHIRGVGPRVLIEGTDNFAPEVNFKKSGDSDSTRWALYKNGDTDDLRFYQGGDKVTIQNGTGNVGIGTNAPARQLHIRGTNAVGRLDRDQDSASFIFVRTAAGDYSTVWKTFTFGVKATGVDSGSFFIGDMHTNVGGSSDNRILIDTNGKVGIGTTAPTERLHVAGNVKATGFITGDITYANGVRTTEEGKGLAFLNDAGEKIAVLDREGNWHIKGKVMEDL